MLLFRAGSFHRLAVPLALVARWRRFRATVSNSRPAGPSSNTAASCFPWSDWMNNSKPPAAPMPMRRAHVIVFADGENRIGMIVDEIVDIVEEHIQIRRGSSRPGILGSAVIGDQVDGCPRPAIDHPLGRTPVGFNRPVSHSSVRMLLIAEGSAFGRGLLPQFPGDGWIFRHRKRVTPPRRY